MHRTWAFKSEFRQAVAGQTVAKLFERAIEFKPKQQKILVIVFREIVLEEHFFAEHWTLDEV